MGRSLTLTNGADSFTQGLVANNVAITLFTLDGNDQVSLNRSDDLGGGNTVDTGAGADTVVSFKELGNIIRLGTGNDIYVGRGFSSFASDPIDQVFAGAGADRIAVETFHSKYFGQTGNDTFFSVGWQNTFNGGAGIDTISYAPRDDDVTQGGRGVTIDLAAGVVQTGANRREFLVSIENAIGSGANDVLFGTSGANRLNGAGGFDELTGRGGADRFVFSRASDSPANRDAVDLVMDFRRAQGDKIELSQIDAKAGVAGNQAFTFLAAAAFSGQAGQLRFDVLSDGVLISGDINGDRVADFQIGVFGHTTMLATDFIL